MICAEPICRVQAEVYVPSRTGVVSVLCLDHVRTLPVRIVRPIPERRTA